MLFLASMSPSESYRTTSTIQTNSAAFLAQTIDRMKTVSNTDPANTQSLIKTLIRLDNNEYIYIYIYTILLDHIEHVGTQDQFRISLYILYRSLFLDTSK